jgi:hypothetical protein
MLKLSSLLSHKPFLDTRKDIFVRLPIVLALAVAVGLAPAIIGFGGAYLQEIITGQPCSNEGSCGWIAAIWLLLITIPIGLACVGIVLVKAVKDIRTMLRSRPKNPKPNGTGME